MRRRDFFYGSSAGVALTASSDHLFAASSVNALRVPLGFDSQSMCAMKWKAPQFIEFAAQQKLDTFLINNLSLFESLEESYLRGLKMNADKHDLRLYIGAGSICENASSFNAKYGTAESFLGEAIRVA